MATSPYSDEFPGRFTVGGLENTTVGPVLASAATIAPTWGVHHVSGTVQITTITPPWTGFTGKITLIPDGNWTLGTGGNIAAGLTAVVNAPVTVEFDGTSWYNVTGLSGAGGALSFYSPLNQASWVTNTLAQSTLILEPLQLQAPGAFSAVGIFVSHNLGASSASSCNVSYTWQVAVYKKSGASLSVATSTSLANTFNVTGTSSAGIHGLHELNIPMALNMTPGNYWYGVLYSSVCTAGAGSAVFSSAPHLAFAGMPGQQSAASGIFGAANTASYQPFLGKGSMSVSTAAIPGVIALSDIYTNGVSAGVIANFKNYSS